MKRNQPSANLGRPIYIWDGDNPDPLFACITREYNDPKHPGYIDAIAFPPGRNPEPRFSVSPENYASLHDPLVQELDHDPLVQELDPEES